LLGSGKLNLDFYKNLFGMPNQRERSPTSKSPFAKYSGLLLSSRTVKAESQFRITGSKFTIGRRELFRDLTPRVTKGIIPL